MRSYQVMRYGRRATLTTNNESGPSMSHSSSFTSISKRRCSMSLFADEQNQDTQSFNENERSMLQSRKTSTANADLLSRRLSIQPPEITEISKSR